LYRAVDAKGISRLGYCRTADGREFSTRPSEPVMVPSTQSEEFGCEDPRVTLFNDTYYVTYTAYSRRGPRIALASTTNFRDFVRLGLVGPDQDDKDCVIFPERIRGKIAVLHRLDSKIQIAYFESFESLADSRNYWSRYVKHFDDYEVLKPKFPWEERKVGVGSPPIKTDRGWLVIYHGVSLDRVYRAGALLLDLEQPRKIIARTKEPILEPVMNFEKKGVVPNVVFPDGAIVLNGELLCYYGGADRVCCVAAAPIDEFLIQMESAAT